MTKIAFITTSKGRLHHIRQTLPLMMAQDADEVIVVDYGCPDGTGDWVRENHPAARVVRVTDDPGFSLARARNLGVEAADADWLIFIDSDVKAHAGWAGWMRDNLRPGHFYRAGATRRVGEAQVRTEREIFGTFVCARRDFERIGGFDEVFRAWGGEDLDLFRRLAGIGVAAREYPSEFVSAIRHGDEERAGLGGMRTKAERVMVTECYSKAKSYAARLLGVSGDLPLDLRRRLLDHTQERMARWIGEGAAGPLTLDFVLDRKAGWAPAPYELVSELRFTIRVTSRPGQDRPREEDRLVVE
jgi:hypothetical protein